MTGQFSHLIPTGVIPATGFVSGSQGALSEASPGVFYGTSASGRQVSTGGSALGTVFRYTLGSQMDILAGFTGTGGQTPGANPQSTLIKDENGNLYGMARAGGASDYGTIFRVSPSGQTTILVEFTGNGPVNKGRRADRGLLRGRDGNFYGVTYGGGAADLGTVFKMTPGGLLTTLVEFTGGGTTNRGAHPICDLVQGFDGHFYGTTVAGGVVNQGTIFKVTGEGVLTTLVEFNDPISGSAPSGAPRRDPGGRFYYGVTERGGANNMGALYATTPAGSPRMVASFSGTAALPRGGMPRGTPVLRQSGGSSTIFDMIGVTTSGGFWDSGTLYQVSSTDQFTTLFDFYGSNGRAPVGSLLPNSTIPQFITSVLGVTSSGGSSDLGTVFQYAFDGSLTPLTTLHHFSGNGASNKGAFPEAGLVQGSDYLYYGCTVRGGSGDFGTIYRADGVDLHTVVEFTGNGAVNKGSHPKAEMTLGSDGNLYGATSRGGAYDCGTIFRLTPDGVLTTLVEFTGNGAINKGRAPECVLLLNSSDGYFYGSTTRGGAYDRGTLFRMTTSGELTTLVEFTGNGTVNAGAEPKGSLQRRTLGGVSFILGTTVRGGVSNAGTFFELQTPDGPLNTVTDFNGTTSGSIGSSPRAALWQDAEGNFYGVTAEGGSEGRGTVFKMSSERRLTTLAEFTGTAGPATGSQPETALAPGNDGALYGATLTGGQHDYGTIYRIGLDGSFTSLVSFTGNSGANRGSSPKARLLREVSGTFLGTTSYGGSNGLGTIFRLTPGGVLTTLVDFSGQVGTTKGSYAQAELIAGSDGNYYGMTAFGGVSNYGTIFRLTPAGVFTTLVEFTGNGAVNKGRKPNGNLVLGDDGNLYGTTTYGGSNDTGTLFRMTLSGELTTLATLDRWPGATLVKGPTGEIYGTFEQYTDQSTGPDTVVKIRSTKLFKLLSSGSIVSLIDFPGDAESMSVQSAMMLGADGSLYGCAGGGHGSIYRILFPGRPDLSAPLAQIQGTTSAVIAIRVNPRGFDSNMTLEFGTDSAALTNSVDLGSVLGSYQTQQIGTELSALSPGLTYFYRFRAVSSSGTTLSTVQSFSTLAAPLASPAAASDLAPASARLNGTVNARNYDTTVRFEWGMDGNSFPNSVLATPFSITGNTPAGVSAPVAGLTKGTTYYYRVLATNAAGTVVSGTQSFRTLTEPTASIGGNFALSTTSVRVEGVVNAQDSDSSVVFEYGTDGVNFPNSVAATPTSVTGSGSTPVSAPLTTLSQGTTYHYRIKATSAGGVGTSASASFSMNVLSGFAQVFPSSPQAAEGFLSVTLAPSGLLTGWRFIGEQQWRASGVPVGGLTTGDREIEFRPVPGYIQPPQETVSVISGEAATVLTRDYYETATTGSGGLSVTLKPDSILSGSGRAQWRLLGENDTQWRDSGSTLTGLIPGSYLIECKAATGRATPPPANVIVSNAQTAVPTITYFLPDSQTGTPPSVLAFETVTTDETKPYAHVGQIRSNVGSSSGFVVKARVVATAGHVVWDDGSLSAVQGLQWLFQRHRGTYEPKPIIPRGFYLFDGYAAQRVIDNSPGDSSPQSQHLDVAAMYFNEDAGRGGYGGFLASDLAQNEFLLSSAQKMLVGYPVDGIALTSQGRMHATIPANILFTAAFGRTFTTSGIRSSGGNSGGPLCLQFEGGNYYPAAIYLGGSNQTVVRAIDSAVIDLFNRAEVSGNGGGNNTGGGITHTSVSTFGSTSNPGSIKILIEPAGAISAGAGWRLSPETSYRVSGAQKSGLNAGNYVLQLPTVPGYDVPALQSVTVSGGQLSTLTFTYAAALTAQQSWRQTFFGITTNTGNAADNADPDGDGMTNLAEYAAGTNPNSKADVFKVSSHQKSGSTFTLTTAGKYGRIYTLQRSTSLASNSWSTVTTQGPLGSDGTVTLTDSAAPAGAGFYRIQVTGP
jgi:uncharacterized repeat protein (TIGR03803 family)